MPGGEKRGEVARSDRGEKKKQLPRFITGIKRPGGMLIPPLQGVYAHRKSVKTRFRGVFIQKA